MSPQVSIARTATFSAIASAGILARSESIQRNTKCARIAPDSSKRKARYSAAPSADRRATSPGRPGISLSRSGTSNNSAQSRKKNTIRFAPSSGSVSAIWCPASVTIASTAPLTVFSVASSTPKTIGAIGRPQRANP
ncbi:GspH/FimT family pseudopilin [Shimia biformata]|uniref:GspH/FimT family pseudopilin n=1 Tax=Shimia biformata TaxID=1294299 RepID=UPI003B82E7D4